MRTIPLVAFLALFSAVHLQARAPEAKALSVAELEQMAPALHEAGDPAATNTLSASRLSERLTPARLEHLLEQMPGRHAREQLQALADEAEFLPLPAADRASLPAPAPADQKRMLARLLEYVQNTVVRWPRFQVNRTATRFEGTAEPIPGGLQDELAAPLGKAWVRSPAAANWECPGHPKLDHSRLAVIEKNSWPILYRQGRQVQIVDSTGGEFACSSSAPSTADEFGEARKLVPMVLSRADVVWSHWENTGTGAVAAFQFVTSVENERGGMAPPLHVELRGEIAFDPATGAIHRLLTTRTWEDKAMPREYRTLMQYGPVTLQGTTYFFPQRRVAIYRTPFLRPRAYNAHAESTYRHYRLTQSPLQEYLVDARFQDYQP